MKRINRVIATILSVSFVATLLSSIATAVWFEEKPDNGNTISQPFAPGTGGSDNFRIPGIVTLKDGTLIAACDARWNHAGDGAGLDTIVSVSKDNGATWTYTFANYLGDNGNTYNNLSTCFIDPGIGTDGTTAYLIADLWPAGIALNTSKYSPVAGENGFDNNGNLLLRDISKDTVKIGLSGYNVMAAKANYDYYLDLDALKLYRYGENGAADVLVEGYTVDAYFNIVSDDGVVNTNLFCADSPYQPFPTDYLYMTTSTDGLNWSTPQLLNLKEENEQTLLVGPGNGTYDDVNDRMIFTAYEHTSGYERSCLIWKDSEGNWKRSQDATVNTWSSEATAVVLADGTVRVFYRDGVTQLRYTDFVWSEASQNYVRDPKKTEVNTAAIVDYGCQLTSIKYSQKVDGKDLILVAGPTSYRRMNGYIYGFLVDEENNMELVYAHNVTPDFYAYSCLTELQNGDIGLLYESAGSALTFVTYTKDEIINRKNNVHLNFKEVNLLTGDSVTLQDYSGYFDTYDATGYDPAIADLQLGGESLGYTELTFTGIGPGYTEVVVGSTVYCITVTLYHNIPVTVPAGKTVIVTDSVADYSGTDLSGVDSSIAEVELYGSSTGVESFTSISVTGLYPGTTELILGRNRYEIIVTGKVFNTTICVGEKQSFLAPDAKSSDQVHTDLVDAVPISSKLGYVPSRGYVDLRDCMYTFTANQDGTWIVSAVAADGTVVYLNHGGSVDANLPNTTASSSVKIQKGYNKDMFKLISPGSPDRSLHFHTEAAEPYWDRCGSDNTYKCQQYIYRPVRAGETSSDEIPGFVRVTSVSGLENGSQYLIAVRSDAGQWYVLNPSVGSKKDQVAKIVDGYMMDITGVAVGEGSFRAGSTIFEITVQQHPEIGERIENEIAATQTQDGSYDKVTFCKHCSNEVSRTTVTIPATGTPEMPDDPNDIQDPTNPQNPTDTDTPVDPGASGDAQPSEKTDMTVFVVIGVAVVLGLVVTLIILKRKK